MSNNVKKNKFHTMINIGLMAFLILVAAFCIASVADAGIDASLPTIGTSLSNGNFMICAFDKCSFI